MTQKLTGGRGKIGALALSGGSIRILRFPVSTSTNGVERSTGFALLSGTVVRRAYVAVKTLEATASTKTISVGLLSSETGGATNGFLNAVSTASAQIVAGNPAFTGTSVQFGSLLAVNAASAQLIRDHVVISGNAKTVTYTLNSAHTELVADVVLEVYEL